MEHPDPIPDIRALAPPPDLAEPWPLWIWFGLAVGALAAGALVAWFVWASERRCPPPLPPDPLATALDRLHALKERYAEIAPGEFATQVAAAVRLPLAAQVGPRLLCLTGDELFAGRAAPPIPLAPALRDRLKSLLETCDAMRFAPTPSSHAERLPLAEGALAFVRDLPSAPPTLTSAPADADPAVA